MPAKPRPARPGRPRTQPHDALSRNYLTVPGFGVSLLRWYLTPDLLRLLDLGTLAVESTGTVDESLAPAISDIRYSVAFKGTDRRLSVCVFVEHQSTKDRFIAFRMLYYIIQLYHMIWRAAKSDGAAAKGEVFPYPIAIILHHGKSPWRNFPRMADLIQKVPGVDPGIFDIPLIVVDLADDATDITRGPPELRAFMETLRASGKGKLKERLGEIAGLLAQVADTPWLRSWTRTLGFYALALYRETDILDSITTVMRKVFGPKEGEEMGKSMLEELREEGFTRGKTEGLAKGKVEAIFEILNTRFGPPSSQLRRKLEAITDLSLLDALVTVAVTCRGLKDFERRVK